MNRRWHEPCFSDRSIPRGALCLTGYFQSSQYFFEFAAEIRRLFDTTPEIKEYVATKYGHLVTDQTSTVVHIRRGDYFSNPANVPFHGVLTPDYYRRALTSATGPLIVFSDDIAWCRGLDFLKAATFVEDTDVASLYLMSQFKQFVLSNSSFSWWAAWLAEEPKTVIVPDRWFGPRGPQDYQDIYESAWIKASVSPPP